MKTLPSSVVLLLMGVAFKGALQLPNRILKNISQGRIPEEPLIQRSGSHGTMDIITDTNLENDLTNLFEGDINLSKGKDHILSNESKRDARGDRRYLWHSGVVPYEISHHLENFVPMIRQALREISSKTCINFVKRTTEENWIYFVRRSGCWSSVGKLYWRPGFQEISLGSGCLMHETVLHEILHALGFWHEQSRPDRDKYIEIFWENIEEGQESNFKRYSHGEADILGIQYDYSSIMHYGSKAFSKNGMDTMKPIKEMSTILGRAKALSTLDVVQLNALYDCENIETVGWSSWSDYSACNDRCLKLRQRFCRQPDVGLCEGANDFGVQTEYADCKRDETECFASINGHWGPWGRWSACSVSCDQGKRIRKRECNDPTPKYDGLPCEGATTYQENCKVKSCDLGEDDCEFDNRSFCHWKNGEGNMDEYNWLLMNGPTPSRKTGPNKDHTSGNGFYVYLEASSPASQGYLGQLVSKLFTHRTETCLVFYYFMYGNNMGSLRVILHGISSNAKEVLWQISGDQGNEWKKQRLAIKPGEDFEIIFEGERGTGFKGDIAVDDVYILEGSCITPGNNTTLVDEKIVVVSTKEPDHVIEVGCFKDHGFINGRRPFPQHINNRDKIDWNNLSKTISGCAYTAKSLGYKIFAVEFYGECWFGPDNEVNYSRDGLTNDCWHGVGKAHAMMVYKWLSK